MITAFEPRGYTGHEYLDDIGIIHMNGRIYDPKLEVLLTESEEKNKSVPFTPLYFNGCNNTCFSGE
ncbi:MAG: hypothetical protein KDI24_13705 [Pseudomonadales bacterium]|nr:hypothetical protein [Pseudomonadales bacterium]